MYFHSMAWNRQAYRLKERLGRDYLLGEGIYVTPSERVAAQYGAPIHCKVTLFKPYVVCCPARPPYPSYIGPIIELDIPALRIDYDGIVLIECVGNDREDMRQAVIFPEHAGQIQILE